MHTRQIMTNILAGMLLASLVVACRESNLRTSELKSVADGNNAFAIDLYQRCKEDSGNLVFSPFNISSAFGMTWAGARGRTQLETAQVMHFHLPPDQYHSAFGALMEDLGRLQQRNHLTLHTANSLWCQDGYAMRKDFLDLCDRAYQAETYLIDFNRSAKAQAEINGWVEKNTMGKIKGLIGDQLTPGTRLVLCSAIYFKGTWEKQFSAKETFSAPFHVTSNKTVTVSMMRQKADFKMTLVDDWLQAIELPYSRGTVSMIILLPMDWDGPSHSGPRSFTLTDLERRLSDDNLKLWLAQLDKAPSHKVNVWLPKFDFESDFDLTQELTGMGMASLFREDADLSGISENQGLYIDTVLHKAMIVVDEEGTEAAAATAVTGRGGADRFFADHPFIFLIRENRTGCILFFGRVVDPSA